jgi:hypothetical protein
MDDHPAAAQTSELARDKFPRHLGMDHEVAFVIFRLRVAWIIQAQFETR